MSSNRIILYKQVKVIAVVLLFFTAANQALRSQAFKIEVFINEQPDEVVVIGRVKGDRFTPVDTVMPVVGKVTFEIPDNATPGIMYRLILGQTPYAQVMHEAPQQIDFIYNKENCLLKSNFNSPLDSMQVVSSKENKVWLCFVQLEKAYAKQLNDLVGQINHFQKNPEDKYYTEKRKKVVINNYNEIQKKRNSLISSTTKKHPDLFATRIIKMYREPFLDGNLTEEERRTTYKRDFFKKLDFSDESLINTPVYTKKVYEYLMSYTKKGLSNEEQIREINRAVDEIIENTKSNPIVGDFIVDFLMRGFETLGFIEMLYHISEVYTPAVPCLSEEKSTLKRRLDSQRMISGTTVPPFSLININGDSISLSDFTNEYKLIIFWASWCMYCEQLLPDIYQWYLNRDLDIEVITISVDSNQNTWKSFVQDRGYDWINCNEPNKWDGKVATAYNIYATPTMFLIDKENQIISKPLTFNEFLDAIIELTQ